METANMGMVPRKYEALSDGRGPDSSVYAAAITG